MKFIEVILSLLKTLLSGWIGKLKENNPAGYRAAGIAFVLIAGFSGVLLQSGAFPGAATILTYVAYAATGLAALFGINELADATQAQVLAKNGNKAQAVAFKWRTVVYLALVGGIFIGVMYLFNKGQKAPAPAEVTPTELQTTPPDVHKPLTRYIVTLLATKADTVETIRMGGLPSFKVPVVQQYTFPLFPVDLGHVPVVEDFQRFVLKDGYKIEKIVMLQIYPDK